MESVRSFIALELTPEIQRHLAQVQNELKKSGADVKWAKPEGIHLTLKFLGNVSLELIDEIKKVIDRVACDHKSFELKIGQLGVFPKIEHPRVIWTGIEQGKEKTLELAQDLEEHLIKLGFLREKQSFHPHLTLGRVRSERNRNQLKRFLQSITSPQETMQAKTLALFKSTLTPQGAIYQHLYEAKLSH